MKCRRVNGPIATDNSHAERGEKCSSELRSLAAEGFSRSPKSFRSSFGGKLLSLVFPRVNLKLQSVQAKVVSHASGKRTCEKNNFTNNRIRLWSFKRCCRLLFRICLQAGWLLILSFTALYWARDWRSLRLVHRWNHLWRASGHFADHVPRREIMGMWMGVQQLLCYRVLIRLIDGHRQMFCYQTMLSTHNVINLRSCRGYTIIFLGERVCILISGMAIDRSHKYFHSYSPCQRTSWLLWQIFLKIYSWLLTHSTQDFPQP